jgi:hypothetical protein
MSDPARRVSDILSRRSGPEDLIVWQASAAEHYLPFLYGRINVMSARELWYSHGGIEGRARAIEEIRSRAWHALAKGASVWFEDRVLMPGNGEQRGDFYVFTEPELALLKVLYDTPTPITPPELPSELPFFKVNPDQVADRRTTWSFTQNENGWSGVNVAGESFGAEGRCFSALADPALYGPPVLLNAEEYSRLEIDMSSALLGLAQIFFRAKPSDSYTEESSVAFGIEPGERTYTVNLGNSDKWTGVIRGLRFDPIEQGDGSGKTMCIKEIRLVP